MWLNSISRQGTLARSGVLLCLLVPAAPAIFGQRPAFEHVALAPARQRLAAANARKAYSAFDSAGIRSMTCEGAVDWETLFKRQATNVSFREQVLPILKGTRFLITLEKDGTVKVSTQATVEPISEAAANRATGSIQSFGGVIATVLEGWARFAVTADLPPATESYQLDKVGDHYLVAFKNGPADVAVTMDRSFMMSDTPDAVDAISGSILTRPKFAPTSGGYLVTSWNVTFPQGRGNDLSVGTRYMQVNGVEVPAEMILRSSLPSFGEVTLPLILTNYQFQQ